jgi:hypothetical protein
MRDDKVYHLLSLADFCLAARYCYESEASIRGASTYSYPQIL